MMRQAFYNYPCEDKHDLCEGTNKEQERCGSIWTEKLKVFVVFMSNKGM